MTYEVEINEFEIMISNTKNYTGIAPYIEDIVEASLSRSDLATKVNSNNLSDKKLNGEEI